jgi:UPF0176 protein
MKDLLVAALYKFVALPDFEELRQPLLDVCNANDVKGTLLLAAEGLNGTIAGSAAGLQAVLDFLRADERLADLTSKHSSATAPPFQRMKVKLKQEIVTMGVPGIDPNHLVGTYVAAEDWNAVLEDPEVIVVDTRNDYEVAIGTFKGAIDPDIGKFRDFPSWLRERIDTGAKPKVAMFCTGGIRCEKSTAFLKQEGVEEVYHLQGGILKYLETVPEEQSLWEGECFVFDERVAIGHGLVLGSYELCRACRWPINAVDKQSPEFELGVSCPHCVAESTPEQRAKFGERIRQVGLAEARGESHMKVCEPTMDGEELA